MQSSAHPIGWMNHPQHPHMPICLSLLEGRPSPLPAAAPSTCCPALKHQPLCTYEYWWCWLEAMGLPSPAVHVNAYPKGKEVGVEEKESWRALPTLSCNRTVTEWRERKAHPGTPHTAKPHAPAPEASVSGPVSGDLVCSVPAVWGSHVLQILRNSLTVHLPEQTGPPASLSGDFPVIWTIW